MLVSAEGYKKKFIAEKSGISYSRIVNITTRGISAQIDEYDRLIEAFPPKIEKNLAPEIDRLIAENEDLKRQVWEALKDKEFQQGTIDRLLKIIEGDKLKE